MKLKYNDQYHSYWLDSVRCKGVTSVAGITDNQYNLQQWAKRQVALGMSLKPELIENAKAHFDDKGELNKIAEQAMQAAGSSEAADRGTRVHRILERFDLGEELIETEQTRALRPAYYKALAGAGLEVVPEYIERIVVYPKENIAGRFDRLYYRKRDHKFVIGDVKTGTSAVAFPHKTCVQLATYINAPLMAIGVPRGGGETEEFEPLPEKRDMKTGYIIHAPSDDVIEVVPLDIARGWAKGWKASQSALAWQAEKDLTKEAVSSAHAVSPNAEADPERVAWIRGRINGISLVGEQAKDLVRLRWPAGMPGRGPWSESDVDVLDGVLASVEKDCNAGFPVRDPAISVARSTT